MNITLQHRPTDDGAEQKELRVTDTQGYIRYPHVEEPMRSRIERIVNEKPAPRPNYTPRPTAELRNLTQQHFYGLGIRAPQEVQPAPLSTTPQTAPQNESSATAPTFEFEGFEMTEDGVLIRRQG